jgi:hypothetical protein
MMSEAVITEILCMAWGAALTCLVYIKVPDIGERVVDCFARIVDWITP